ncbi:hypothetical protein G7046_g2731 [Stylonectria norvegica]|nr:hypothetical protein G7046_g2731 [Stylonectria norvegica]
MSSAPRESNEPKKPKAADILEVNADPWTDDKRQKFETKSKSEFFDPCQEAAQRSYKCLFRNNGDKNMCGDYFQCVPGQCADWAWTLTGARAYRDCKQQWTEKLLMNRQRPPLKNGVDLQLQSAFNDGNWAVVIRLAEKRAKASNDQYFEIVKLCAESHLDEPSAKFAAVAAIAQFVKDGTVIKDADAIDLLEWSTGDITEEEVYSETLGPLRTRLVKAVPKDKVAGSRCLESCLLHWDLVSAQQIAAILDRSFPQDRSLLFWNISITHHLAISSQSPPEKKKLYGMLALKQIQRAAQLTEQADASANLPARSIQTEEETLLLYEIVQKHGTNDDFEKLMTSSVFCPLEQFRQGRKELFLRVVAKQRQESDWEASYLLCKDCLSITDENGEPNMLVSDWTVWRAFINAAGQIKTVNPDAESSVQTLLLKFAKSPSLRPIYRRNVMLARVLAAFSLASNDGDDLSEGKPTSLRLRELVNYVADQGASAACFDDIKSFAEKLSAEGLKHLAYDHTPRLADESDSQVKSARVRTLALKLQYLAATCPFMYNNIPGEKPLRKCIITDEEFGLNSCSPSFSKIAQAGLELYRSLEDMAPDHLEIDAEIRPELAMLIALCNIQLAFAPSTNSPRKPSSLQPLFRALLVLEHQLSLATKHSVLSLFLVQLHLYLGSAPRSREVWETLGVKRTVMDSLGSLFYDRLSTVSPFMLAPTEKRGWHLVELLQTHYSVSLKLRMPRRLIDAFEAGSYGSVLSIPKYTDNLRWSCTRAMSLVEEVRTERLLGQQYVELFQDSRNTEVTDDTKLTEVIDYGSLPAWGCSSSEPAYELISVGPRPSNRRSHLSLLSEAFHQTLAYKPPAPYKASAVASIADRAFVHETLSQLSNSFTKFLREPATDLTPQESIYFEVISLLSTLIPFSLTIGRSVPLLEVFSQIVHSLKVAINDLRVGVSQEGNPETEGQITMLSSMHAVAIFRDTASAVKQSSQWILAFHEPEKERDRSGKSNLPKDVVLQIKDLQAAADAALKDGKDWVAKLARQFSGRDFESKARRWVFDGANDLQDVVGDAPMAKLMKSWEENVKAWLQVKWA